MYIHVHVHVFALFVCLTLLASFFHLSFKNMYMYIVYTTTRTLYNTCMHGHVQCIYIVHVHVHVRTLYCTCIYMSCMYLNTGQRLSYLRSGEENRYTCTCTCMYMYTCTFVIEKVYTHAHTYIHVHCTLYMHNVYTRMQTDTHLCWFSCSLCCDKMMSANEAGRGGCTMGRFLKNT